MAQEGEEGESDIVQNTAPWVLLYQNVNTTAPCFINGTLFHDWNVSNVL
jgi:hypothetical protein